MRERVIRAICDAGFNLHIIGKGFEAITLADGSHPESTALMPTEYCLNETALSKISVNVMPWFRDGSHDRILSSMLCGSVTFSDPSLWLDNNFTGREMCFYDLNNMSELTSHIADILDDPSEAMEIAAGGRKKPLHCTHGKQGLQSYWNILRIIRRECFYVSLRCPFRYII